MAKKKGGKKGKGGDFARVVGALRSMGVSKKAIATHDVTKGEYKQAAAIVHNSESVDLTRKQITANIRRVRGR